MNKPLNSQAIIENISDLNEFLNNKDNGISANLIAKTYKLFYSWYLEKSMNNNSEIDIVHLRNLFNDVFEIGVHINMYSNSGAYIWTEYKLKDNTEDVMDYIVSVFAEEDGFKQSITFENIPINHDEAHKRMNALFDKHIN